MGIPNSPALGWVLVFFSQLQSLSPIQKHGTLGIRLPTQCSEGTDRALGMTGAHMVDVKTTELSGALSSASNTGEERTA